MTLPVPQFLIAEAFVTIRTRFIDGVQLKLTAITIASPVPIPTQLSKTHPLKPSPALQVELLTLPIMSRHQESQLQCLLLIQPRITVTRIIPCQILIR